MIIIHGGGLNAGKSFETGQKVIESLDIDKSRVMVLAPRFLVGINPGEKGLLFGDER
jgi:hypothetical protein